MADVNFKGIYAAVVTPFDQKGHFDRESFAAHLAGLAQKGCHGVLLSGTTGEGPSLSVKERMTLFEAAKQADTRRAGWGKPDTGCPVHCRGFGE